MDEKRNDGGPAFPVKGYDVTVNGVPLHAEAPWPGLSLRDYFAAAALSHVPKLLEVQGLNLTVEMIAEWSYEISDAMLAERERKQP